MPHFTDRFIQNIESIRLKNFTLREKERDRECSTFPSSEFCREAMCFKATTKLPKNSKIGKGNLTLSFSFFGRIHP